MPVPNTTAIGMLIGLIYLSALESASDVPPTIGGCNMFPANSWWNTPIESLPVHAKSATWINSIGPSTGLKADFGSGLWEGSKIGIPYVVVPQSQPNVPINYIWYGDESDPGPFPIPADAPIEGDPNDGDRHILVVQQGTCKLFELYYCYKADGAGWDAGSGAKWDLSSNAFRPLGWTSSDAAGLPVLPGLVRYPEIVEGEIRHAIRFTAPRTRAEYVWPATHLASSDSSTALPPMGARFRLKASFDISPYPAVIQIILRALKKYGLVLADNGSAWYMSGAPDERWDNDMLNTYMRRIIGSNLEAVDVSSLMISPSSGEARQSVTPGTPSMPPSSTSPTSKAPTTKTPTRAPITKGPTKTPTRRRRRRGLREVA